MTVGCEKVEKLIHVWGPPRDTPRAKKNQPLLNMFTYVFGWLCIRLDVFLSVEWFLVCVYLRAYVCVCVPGVRLTLQSLEFA